MSFLGQLQSWFRRKKVKGTIDDELRFHLDKEVEQNIALGMSPQEARRQALISFGGMQQTRENVRHVRWTHFAEVLVQDLRYGWRILRKSPGFTTVAILTLALGIGMNAAIFSLMDGVIFRSLPVRDPQSLVVLKWEAHKEPKTEGMMNLGDCADGRDKAHPSGCSLPLPLLKQIKTQTSAFSNLAASTGFGQMDLGGNGPAKRVQGQFVSGSYFVTLGVQPAAGRLFSPAEDQPEAPPVAVLNYKFWQSDFGGSPSVVGKTVRLNSKPYTIVGVTESGFTNLSMANQFDLWVPLSQQKNTVARWFPGQADMGFFGYVMLGRVKAGVPVSQAEAAADVVFRNATLLPAKPFFKAEDDPHLRLVAAQKELRGRYDLVLQPVYVLMFCVSIILLIACANVAGLLLARAAGREREIAVRLALGASRTRLLAQLLVESLTLSVAGGALGLLMAVSGARALMTLLFSGRLEHPTFSPQLDWRVLAFTAVVSILTGLIFGMAPAIRGLRVDLTPSLKIADASSPSGFERRRFSMGNLLVATQVALAVLVLATAALLVRTLNNLESLDPGFDTNNILLFHLDPRLAGYKGPQVGHLYRELQEKFAALPGVKSVSYSWMPLLSGGHMATMFHRPGTPVDSKDQIKVDIMEVGPNFLGTLRIPLRAGRDLTAAEFEAASRTSPFEPVKVPAPVVVNQAFVRTYCPNTNPLGQVFGDSLPESPWPAFPGYQVVGVAGDAKYNTMREDIKPAIYTAISDGNASFELRTAADPASLIPAVRKTVSSVDENLAIVRIGTQKGEIDRQLAEDRMVTQLSSFFGLLALLLACMGLYGLLAYEVTRRTREIGIRMAIGAQQKDVVGMVVRQGLLVALAGAVMGAGASFAVSGLVKGILYHVRTGDPVTLAAVIAILLVVALAACFLPARRASRVDPLVALRYE
jgi:predicted permease